MNKYSIIACLVTAIPLLTYSAEPRRAYRQEVKSSHTRSDSEILLANTLDRFGISAASYTAVRTAHPDLFRSSYTQGTPSAPAATARPVAAATPPPIAVTAPLSIAAATHPLAATANPPRLKPLRKKTQPQPKRAASTTPMRRHGALPPLARTPALPTR